MADEHDEAAAAFFPCYACDSGKDTAEHSVACAYRERVAAALREQAEAHKAEVDDYKEAIKIHVNHLADVRAENSRLREETVKVCDELAQLAARMEGDFKREHPIGVVESSPIGAYQTCLRCGMNLNDLDPRHNYTPADWLAAARRVLEGE